MSIEPQHAPLLVEVEIDAAPLSPNRLLGEHWKSRAWRREKERRATQKALDGKAPPPGPNWEVTFTRVASRKFDAQDTLPFSFKSFVDEVAAWMGLDDGDPRVVWRYAQEVQRVHVARKLRKNGQLSPAFKVWARLRIESGAIATCETCGHILVRKAAPTGSEFPVEIRTPGPAGAEIIA